MAAILERANREFSATFDVERSRRDTLLYPYEVVRSAVANVLLKEARGYRFENPGAVLWDGITLPRYRLEEFAVANLEEVRKRCEGTWPVPPVVSSIPPVVSVRTSAPPDPELVRPGESEKRRAQALRELHASLPEPVRVEIDRRAREQVLASSSPGRIAGPDDPVLALRVHRVREEILEREYGGALTIGSIGSQGSSARG